MAKQQSNQPQRRPQAPAQETRRQAPAAPSSREKTPATNRFNLGSNELIYDRQNFIWMGVGLGLIVLGLFLMSGGKQPDPTQWDESIIYSPMRITVAPILMVAGFLVEIYAIFKRPATAKSQTEEAA